jgi:hypothetical protein
MMWKPAECNGKSGFSEEDKESKDVKNGVAGGVLGNEPPALFVRQRIVGLLRSPLKRQHFVWCLHCIRGKQNGFRSSPVPADII